MSTSTKAPLDDQGREVPDPTPLTLPAGFRRPETLAEQVQRLVRTHISREAAERGEETFEEAEDFDVPDEAEPGSPYEAQFDPVLGRDITPDEFRRHEQLYRQRMLAKQAAEFAAADHQEALRAGPRRSREGAAAGRTNAPVSDADPKAAAGGSVSGR